MLQSIVAILEAHVILGLFLLTGVVRLRCSVLTTSTSYLSSEDMCSYWNFLTNPECEASFASRQ